MHNDKFLYSSFAGPLSSLSIKLIGEVYFGKVETDQILRTRNLFCLLDELEELWSQCSIKSIFLKVNGVSLKGHPAFYLLDGKVDSIYACRELLSHASNRLCWAISSFLEQELESTLEVFPWHDIPAWSEFRLFIRDRKLIGVSQYHHQEAYPEIQENLKAIKASLIPFSRQLIDALHMDTVVADVFVEKQADNSFKTTLIELNPFIQRTDPCLYSWQNGGDFDGGIRYHKLRYNPYRNTTSSGRSAEPLGLFREEDYRRQ